MCGRVKLVITKHAFQRIRERAGNPYEVLRFLVKNELTLLRNREGYEITVPLKGRIVGDFDNEVTFIAKSFKFPFGIGKDIFVYGRRSRSGHTMRVSSVVLPWKRSHPKLNMKWSFSIFCRCRNQEFSIAS